jgi:ferritin-like metal-binding protein YciE
LRATIIDPFHLKGRTMPINNTKDLFVRMLSDLRRGSERSTKIYQELSQLAQDEDVKEALEARAYVSKNVLNTLDECFKLIGQKPIETTGRIQEVFMEDFRRELNEIQLPEAKRLFVLAKAMHLVHFRIAEYVALIAMADVTGHFGVGVLLESALADKLAFIERTRRLIRHRIEARLAA